MSPLLQPLYGLFQAKLQLITHAYFEEKDFSQISILKVRKAEAALLVAPRSPAAPCPLTTRVAHLRPDRSCTST